MLPGPVPVACIANDDSNFLPVELDAKAAFRRELKKVGVTPSYGNPTLFRLRGSLYALMANHEYGVKVDDVAAITRATVRARREIIDMVDALAKKGGEPWRGARAGCGNAPERSCRENVQERLQSRRARHQPHIQTRFWRHPP